MAKSKLVEANKKIETGVVLVSAVLASSSAVSSMAAGFATAKKVITNIFLHG